MSEPARVGGGQTAVLPGAQSWWWLCSAPGLTSEGIYRKSGQNSKTTSLLEMLRRDARSVRLKEGEHHVDDVANTLKRFFRDLGDGLFTRRWSQDWLRATGEGEGHGEGGEGASRCRKAEPGPLPARSSRCASGVQMFPLAGTVAVSQSRRAPSPGWGEECARRPRTQVWLGGGWPFAPGSGPPAPGLEAPGCQTAKKSGVRQPQQLGDGVGGSEVGSGYRIGWVGVLVLVSRPFMLAFFPLAALEDEEAKIGEYWRLLETLPTVNRATLKALINHLFRYVEGPQRPVGHRPIFCGVLWGCGVQESLHPSSSSSRARDG